MVGSKSSDKHFLRAASSHISSPHILLRMMFNIVWTECSELNQLKMSVIIPVSMYYTKTRS